MYTKEEQSIIDYLKLYKKESGLYIITIKNGKEDVLKKICDKLGLTFTSHVAYVGKGARLKTTDLYTRSRQEMGWSNFSGATFVKKIGLYLDIDVNQNKKIDQIKTRKFIMMTFNINCKILPKERDILDWETENILALSPVLNSKKIKTFRQLLF